MATIFVEKPFKTEYKGKRVIFSPSTMMFEVEDDFVELDIVKRCCKIIKDTCKKDVEKTSIDDIKDNDYTYKNEDNFTVIEESNILEDSKRGRKKKIVE